MGKTYSGRLAYNPDSGYHIDPDGNPVITADNGKTWTYADETDPSHYARYHQGYAQIDTTANAVEPEPHHFAVQSEDPHFDGVRYDPDVVAPTVTSHTEAWT